MRKSLTAAVSALVVGGLAATAAVPAQAQTYRGERYDHRYDRRHNNDNDAGVAIAAGVIGLALGAMLGSSSRNDGYYNDGYYNDGYHDPRYSRGYGNADPRYNYGYGYGYQPRPRVCERIERRRDPYSGRIVQYRHRFAC